LRGYGITEIWEQVGVTGVVALIRGDQPGPCIALRADIDGLPITETADIEYKSKHDGNMHACGHDGHISGLLGAVKILLREKLKMKGVIKLVFQPAEEGGGGAREMIKDGVLEEGRLGPKVDAIYGLHIWSFDKLGNIGCSNGPVMAASDYFCIEVKGKGGHGAAPHTTVDAIVEAAHLVTALQTVTSRSKDPLETGVLTVGKINGGYANNIIADLVTLRGTCRSFNPDTQELIKERMGCICCGIAQTYGGEIDLSYNYGYPPTVNAYPECTQRVVDAATPIVGKDRAGMKQMTMGAEDFSFFLQERPGCFFFVGAALSGEVRSHHKSVFDFDERCLMVGASIFINIIRDLLEK
jgi:amidohydrolase